MQQEDQDQQQQPLTLEYIFSQEPAPTPTPAKRRAYTVYRSYYGGTCQNPKCNQELGLIETEGGRDRHYCSDACRVAHYRQRQREKKRAAILQYNTELRDYWGMHGIRGEVLLRLQEILLRHGKEAARAATDAVLVALEVTEQAGRNEQVRLIDECMLSGEALSFPEIKLEDFRIPAGVAAWSEFVTYASTNQLRQLRGYLYQLQQREAQHQRARARMEELSRPYQDDQQG